MAAAKDEKTRNNNGFSPQNAASPGARVPALRPAQPERARTSRFWVWTAVALIGLVIAAIATSQFWMPRPTPVIVEIAKRAPVTRVLAVNGRIAAVHSVDVRPTVSGTLVELPVAEGDVVETDQVLAQVDAAAQNAAVRQAMAALDAAIVAQQQASEDYDRALSLGGTIARTTLEANAFALQAATQEVAQLTAFLDQSRIALDTYTIRAPVAGTVLELDVEMGQAVSPSTRLLTLADLSELVVEADVDEAYATQIETGQPAVLQLAGQTGTHDGHVSYVSNRVNAATGGLAIEISFDEAVRAPIGLTVATNIIVEKRDAALTVPRTALVNGNAVFVVVDGVAEARSVSVVDWPAARLIATDGLVEGDVVIVDAAGIADGQDVSVERP